MSWKILVQHLIIYSELSCTLLPHLCHLMMVKCNPLKQVSLNQYSHAIKGLTQPNICKTSSLFSFGFLNWAALSNV
jgi:hypothetical protein